MGKIFDSPDDWFKGGTKKTKKSRGAGGGRTSRGSRPPKATKPKTAKAINATVKSKPQVMVKVSGSSKGCDKAQAHANYIGRNGEVELEDETGQKFKGVEQKEVLKAWQAMGIPEKDSEGKHKEALHIVFSMPNGTNPQAMKTAVKNLVEEEFTGHKYFIAQHLDTKNPHCHVLLCATDDRGARLNIKKQDLHNYRVNFVAKLAEQGIEATASRKIHRLNFKDTKRQGVYHRDIRENKPNTPKPLSEQSFQKIKKTHESVIRSYTSYQSKLPPEQLELKLDINQIIAQGKKELDKAKAKKAKTLNTERE